METHYGSGKQNHYVKNQKTDKTTAIWVSCFAMGSPLVTNHCADKQNNDVESNTKCNNDYLGPVIIKGSPLIAQHT